MQASLLARALTIAAVAVALLLPIALIEGKIGERRARASGVVAQFAAESTGPQVVAGPFLALICEETYVDERQVMHAGKAETVAEKKTRSCPTGYFPPRTLKVAGDMPVESRHRGIYQIRVYSASLEIAGELEWPAPAAPNGANARAWKSAYLVMGVSDPRGIKAAKSATSQSLGRDRAEGLERSFAIHEALGDYASKEKGAIIPFGYQLSLAGISTLHIAPVGDATEIRLASTWPHPSFNGGWSPDERRVDSGGFQATWRTTSLATGGQAFWEKIARDGKLQAPETAAGVSLFEPVNAYALSYRATQYAFLFILFTFAALALVETLAGVRLHPMQYALVGSALAVFFLLLIALSEHFPFPYSYSAGATACIALLTVYLRHPLGSAARSAAFFLLFTALYGSLYAVLQSEDEALLLGSLMVFTLLAIVMITTRKVDWSEVARRMVPPKAAVARPG